MGSELPAGWHDVRLGDCGRWLSGGTPSTKNPAFWDGDIPWISSKSLTTYYLRESDRRVTTLGAANGTRIAPPGSTLMVVRGMSLQTEFRSGIAMRELAFGQDCKAIIPREGIEPHFLANAVRARAPEILGMVDSSSHGTGRLATELIQGLRIGLPSIEEQRAIAEVLGALDDRLEWCDAGVDLAYELQDALFAELNARQELPRQPLGDFVQLDKGVSYKGAKVTDDPSALALVNLGNFGRGRAPRWEKLKHYTGQTRPRHHVSPGDVVVCATDMTHDRIVLGKALVVPELLPDAAISHHLYAVRIHPEAPVSPWLVALALSHEPIRRVVASFANGTTVLALPRDAVHRVEIPLPTPEQLAVFDDSVAELHAAIELANSEAATLRRIREALLPRLLSGELRIEDPARVLGAVA